MKKKFNKLSIFFKNFFKNYFVFIFLLIIFFANSYALFHKEFFHVHDFTQAARIAEMAKALDQGQFPVRWSNNFGYGFGMPLFNFYAPLPYFIGAIFFKLGCDVVLSIKLLYFFINILSMLGAYLLGKKLLGRWGGLLLAAAYTLAPYRALNLFVRGAISEAFAMAFLPFVLFAIVSFIKKQDKKYLFTLLISLVSIILSHNLTALIFIPMAALYTFVYLLYLKKIKLLWPIAGQFLLAFALAAFYIFPAFMEKDLTKIESIFSGYFHYSHHFLYIRQFFKDNWQYGGSAWGPDDDISFFLGKGQLLAIFVLLLATPITLLKNFKNYIRKPLFFFTLLFGSFLFSSLIMSTMRSQILWDKFEILQYIQFPWRFLSVASMFLALLVALSAYLIPKKKWRAVYGILVFSILLCNSTYFKPKEYLDNAEALYYTDPLKIQNRMSETLPDYIPAQMAEEKILAQSNRELADLWVVNNSDKNLFSMMFDNGFEKMAIVKFQGADLLNFKVANFAGWKAELDGNPVEIDNNKELGNIQVLVPEGDHQIGIYFSEDTVARKIGDASSILALLIILYFFYPFAKNKKQE